MIKNIKIRDKKNIIYLMLICFFSFYSMLKIMDGLNEARCFFYDSKTYKYIDASESLRFEIPIKTNNLSSIHIPISLSEDISIDDLDLNISLDGISSERYMTNIFTPSEKYKDYYLGIAFYPYNLKIKEETVAINLSGNNLLVKVDDRNVPLYKLYGLKKSIVLLVEILFVFIVCFFIYLTTGILKVNTWKIENKFLFYSIFLGIGFLFVRPPCSQYDDLYHYDSAYNMSNIILGVGSSESNGTLLKRKCDLNLLPDFDNENYEPHGYRRDGKNYRNYYIHLIKNIRSCPDKDIVPSTTKRILPPQRAFFFSALAISFCRIMRFNQFITYYSGCIINFLIAIFLVWWSIRKNKVLDNNPLLCFSLSPVILMEFASYSYDCILIAVSFAIINMFLEICCGQRKKGLFDKDIILLTILCIFVFPIKTLYFPIALFAILLFFFKDFKLLDRFLKISISVAFIFYLLICILLHFVPIDALNMHQYNHDLKSFCFSYADILLHPIYDFKILLNYLSKLKSCDLCSIEALYIYVLDDVSLYFKRSFFILFALLFMLKNNKFSRSIYICSNFVFLLVVGLVFCGFLSLTPISWEIIYGIQIRYFIPVLPLLFLTVQKLVPERFYINIDIVFNITVIISMFYLVEMFLNIIF